jgi:pimeloyl-ACP methyl ester carboxylesterase
MFDMRVSDFDTSDGLRIAVHEMGPNTPSARAVILVHGFFSDAETNWIKYGHAAMLAEAGFRVIMPDLRAHGLSDKPHETRFYPKDILADDQFALIDEMGLTDFDLAGYSLGGRTVARMLARGCKPRRTIISGMGLEGLTSTGTRGAYFAHILDNVGTHERGSPEWLAEAFLKTTGGDPVALRRILDSFVDTPPEALATLDVPIAVVCGVDDQDNGSAAALADILPNAELISVAGNHMSAVAKPSLGAAFLEFLTRP